jgi:hypothetical protein
MSGSSQTERETRNSEIQERWHDKVFRPNNRSAPGFLDGEKEDHYRKRLMDRARSLVAADLQNVKTDDLYGTALDHYEQQYFESAAAEAQRPTNIAEGTLKQVTRYDNGGRPFYEFFGSPRTWMNTFSSPPKKLVGIRTQSDVGYRPGNLG